MDKIQEMDKPLECNQMFSGSEPGNAFVGNQSFFRWQIQTAQQSSNDFLDAFWLRPLERNLRISVTSKRLSSILRAEILRSVLSRRTRRRKGQASGLAARGLRVRSPGIGAFLCVEFACWNMNLCAVRLSQKVMVPSVPRVSTQQCGVPLALVPTHT